MGTFLKSFDMADSGYSLAKFEPRSGRKYLKLVTSFPAQSRIFRWPAVHESADSNLTPRNGGQGERSKLNFKFPAAALPGHRRAAMRGGRGAEPGLAS
jgi:hypothetical protein